MSNLSVGSKVRIITQEYKRFEGIYLQIDGDNNGFILCDVYGYGRNGSRIYYPLVSFRPLDIKYFQLLQRAQASTYSSSELEAVGKRMAARRNMYEELGYNSFGQGRGGFEFYAKFNYESETVGQAGKTIACTLECQTFEDVQNFNEFRDYEMLKMNMNVCDDESFTVHDSGVNATSTPFVNRQIARAAFPMRSGCSGAYARSNAAQTPIAAATAAITAHVQPNRSYVLASVAPPTPPPTPSPSNAKPAAMQRSLRSTAYNKSKSFYDTMSSTVNQSGRIFNPNWREQNIETFGEPMVYFPRVNRARGSGGGGNGRGRLSGAYNCQRGHGHVLNWHHGHGRGYYFHHHGRGRAYVRPAFVRPMECSAFVFPFQPLPAEGVLTSTPYALHL